MSSVVKSVIEKNVIQMSAYVTLSGGVPTVVKSSNLSSLTDRGVGRYTGIPATDLPSANYVLSGTSENYRKISCDNNSVARAVDGVPIMVSIGGSVTDLNFSFIVTGA